MGGQWVRFNKMTERQEYLHLAQQHVDTFTNSWSLVSSRLVNQAAGKDHSYDIHIRFHAMPWSMPAVGG
jgi:hypothetical protein